MRHGKRPTKKQKILLKEMGLVPENWLIIRDDTKRFVIQHRYSGKTRTLNRESET